MCERERRVKRTPPSITYRWSRYCYFAHSVLLKKTLLKKISTIFLSLIFFILPPHIPNTDISAPPSTFAWWLQKLWLCLCWFIVNQFASTGIYIKWLSRRWWSVITSVANLYGGDLVIARAPTSRGMKRRWWKKLRATLLLSHLNSQLYSSPSNSKIGSGILHHFQHHFQAHQ